MIWGPNGVLCDLDGDLTFTINDAKRYVPVVTLSRKDSVKLSKLLSEGFKRPVYWNAYKVIAEKSYNKNNPIREIIDSSSQVINRFFVLAYEGGANRVTADSHKRYFLPRVEIKNYDIEVERRNFSDQPINNQIKKQMT